MDSIVSVPADLAAVVLRPTLRSVDLLEGSQEEAVVTSCVVQPQDSTVSILGEPMVLSGQFGSENRRSKWSPSIFGLFAHFYGQKLPQKAINEAYWAISRPGGSNLADPGGSRLDLGGIHPGGCVTAF